jgi:hypothetical protein
MTDEPGLREPSRTPAPRGRRFKPHEIGLADDGRLVLGSDGSIEHLDAHGSKVHRWELDDPEWPDQAIRFGLHPQTHTITPQGRYVQGTKPPRR